MNMETYMSLCSPVGQKLTLQEAEPLPPAPQSDREGERRDRPLAGLLL